MKRSESNRKEMERHLSALYRSMSLPQRRELTKAVDRIMFAREFSKLK